MTSSPIRPSEDTASPLVSVIIIFLNGEPYFEAAIDSVLAQTFQDFELILVDDGSTDASTGRARALAAAQPGRIIYLGHDGHANRGMSATRNLGIRHARGTFIAFIDADDVWRPGKLAEQVAIMGRHPELGMVCGAVNYWRSWAGESDAVVPTGHVHDAPLQPPEALLNLYPLGTAAAPCPSDLLLRRDVVLGLGGFEEHFTGPRQMYEDQGFLAKLYLAAPVYFASAVWLDYRQHPDSIVAQVKQAGRYHEVRRYFLLWFERYLRERKEPAPPAAQAALRKALWRYRHPLAFRTRETILSLAMQAGQLPRRAARRLKRALE